MAHATIPSFSLATSKSRDNDAKRPRTKYFPKTPGQLFKQKAGYLLVAGYLIFSSLIQYKIIFFEEFNAQQKLSNSLLFWIVSSIWIVIILGRLLSHKPGSMNDYQLRLKKYGFTYN
jgi:hypothetical protein